MNLEDYNASLNIPSFVRILPLLLTGEAAFYAQSSEAITRALNKIRKGEASADDIAPEHVLKKAALIAMAMYMLECKKEMKGRDPIDHAFLLPGPLYVSLCGLLIDVLHADSDIQVFMKENNIDPSNFNE